MCLSFNIRMQQKRGEKKLPLQQILMCQGSSVSDGKQKYFMHYFIVYYIYYRLGLGIMSGLVKLITPVD